MPAITINKPIIHDFICIPSSLFLKLYTRQKYTKDVLRSMDNDDASSYWRHRGCLLLALSGQSSCAHVCPLLDHSGRELESHTTVPTNFPIPAVRAIANAPQNVTRTVARKILAPPAFAPIAPRSARNPNEAANTIGTRTLVGDTTTMSKGMAAPMANDAAEVSAACTGRAVVISEIPSSSRA